MILEKMETYVVENPPPCIGGQYFFFVKLVTDEGIEGWGEVAIQWALHPVRKAFDAMAQGLFETFLKGRDPMDRDALLQFMYMRFSSSRPDQICGGFISAFDLALWDIVGKSLNTPVYNLLGGKMRNKLRSYTYLYRREDIAGKTPPLSFGEVWINPELAAKCAYEMAEDGFTAIKYDPVPLSIPLRGETYMPPTPWQISLEDLHNVDLSLKLIRKEIGDNIDILIGTHGQLDTAAAIRVARVLEDYDCLWFEEPTGPENREEMARIAAATSIPVASGERLTSVHEFHSLLKTGAVAVVQPDLGAAGGITEGKKIASLAEPLYVKFAPHTWGGPLIAAAAYQLDLNVPNFLMQETLYKGGGFMAELLEDPIKWEDGYIIPSDRPGLGYTLVESQLQKYRVF